MTAPTQARPAAVLITRAARDAQPLAAEVARLGAQAVCVPAVHMEELPASAAIEQAIAGLAATHAIAFASRYGVGAFARALAARGQALPKGISLFAVGPSTGAQVARLFEREPHVGLPHTAVGMAQHLSAALPPQAQVLLPTALGAGEALATALLDAGLRPTLLPLYRTVSLDADGDALTKAAAVDYIVFTSPSCVASWQRWGRPAENARLLTMGPSTSRAVRAAGLQVHAEAVPSSFAGLVALLKAVLCPPQ